MNRYFKNRYKILVGKPEENRSLGRSRRRWDDKMILKKQGVRM
jgi:hypothetical protein